MLKPRRLKRGDKVATVSLSWGGPGAIAHRYEAGKRQLEEEFGVQVVEMPHTLADWGGEIPARQFEEYDEALLQVVTHEEGLDSLPIVSRMDFGHTDPMFVLPYGVQAEIDCDRRQFAICEPAVIQG